ncbi:MAG: EAL domain-containing protein, partial [Rhizobiales bacterium]|nr:EAL domain-containing protein [Hyphomicrobiales bacterium]
PADMAGLLPQLDNLMLFRAVQVARRLTARSRDGGVFCNLANATLVDSRVFSQVYDFLSANRALAPALIFEFGQAALRAMGPIEQESLSQIADLGFRFSMDQVSDLHFEPRALAEQGFRFVKAPAALLLASPVATTAEIPTSAFANLLGRFGIELIADRIETEAAVIDLLDYDLRFAQGQLFAPPRPVRGDVFQSAAVPLPETPHPPAPRAPAPPLNTAPTGAAPPAAPPLSGLRALARPVAAPVARTTGRPDAMAGAADAAPQNMPERDLSGLVALARAFGRKV